MQTLDHYTATNPNHMCAASAALYVAGIAISSASLTLSPSLPGVVAGIAVTLVARKILWRCYECSQHYDRDDVNMTLGRRISFLESRPLTVISKDEITFAIIYIAGITLALAKI